MELPIAAESYQPSMSALIRAAKRSHVVLGRMAGAETALDAATAIVNVDRPSAALANFAAEFHVPDDRLPAEALRQVLAHFEQSGVPCGSIDAAGTDWDAELPQLLSEHDYYPSTRLVCVLQDYRAPQRLNERLQIIPARAAYSQVRAFCTRMAQVQDRADPALAATIADIRIDHLDEPRLEVFLGRLDHEPVGIAGVLTLGNIGVLSDVFTEPDRRGQGVAASLLAHTLEHCKRAAFERVIMDTPQSCPHLPFFQALGFMPLSTYTRFRKRGGM